MNFLIFGTKCGLPNATEVTFPDFAKKIPFGRFWPILVKNGHFGQKSTFRPVPQNLLIGSSHFFIFILLYHNLEREQ